MENLLGQMEHYIKVNGKKVSNMVKEFSLINKRLKLKEFGRKDKW